MAEAAFIDLARLARIAAMLVLGMLAIYVEAAPLGTGPDAPPSPDLLLCVVFYWTVRRPGSTPMPAVFALGVVRDMLTDVPAGAGALALVLACEAVRQVRHRLARASFTLEWLALSAAALATASFIWLLTALTLTQPPYVIALFHQSLYTIMAYPLVVIAFRWGLRISWRKAAGPA
jgi:rod shape-determining protein MreD